MATINEQRRLILKRSGIPGTVPTVPAVDDINTFTATDIFKGELFYNIPDNILYTRDNTGIVIVASGGPGPTYVYYTENTTPGSEYGQIEINDTGLIGRTKVEAGYVRTAAGNPTTDAVNIISDVTSAGNPSLGLSTSNSSGIITSINQSSSTGIVLNSDNSIGDNSEITITPIGITSTSTDGTTTSYVICNSSNSKLASNDGTNSSYIQTTPSSGIESYSNDGVSNYSHITTTPLSTVIQSGDSGVSSEITVETNRITLNTNTSGKITIQLQAYANDTDAGLGGLTTGDLYQTDGTGTAPLNVAGIVMIKQ